MRVVAAVCCVLLLAACEVGPDYERPAVASPSAWKETAGWAPADPGDERDRGPWWHVFADPLLDELVQRATRDNFDVAAALARFRAADALVRQTRAGWYPEATGNVAAARSRSPGATGGSEVTNYAASVDVRWEIDVWGRVARSVEASTAVAASSLADFAAVRLSVQATLAADYFELRTLDATRRLLEGTSAAYERQLELIRNRVGQGVSSNAEIVLAETQVQSTRAQAIDVGVRRAQLEHAIAVLAGVPPSELGIDAHEWQQQVPRVPVGLPSQLLERRPDVASAERRVAAASARIGIAAAAAYPSLTLDATAGYRSTDLSNWITAPARFWSFGPALAMTLFDGGAIRAATEGAAATLDATAADYRTTVLLAFAEVEDQCAALRILEQEETVQAGAVTAARRSLDIAQNQYKAGLINYLDVITVQTVAYANERNAVDLHGRRLIASVALLKALGGNWQPNDDATAAAGR
jgi:NodT family efflux transporter outer membrane factor (OMF) lipoprotein